MKTQVLVLVLAQIISIVLGCDCVAQVVPDQTLPVGERSQVSGDPNLQIDGGAIRESNLFHSFQQFSIPTNGSVSFNNSANIANIITRVTGGTRSDIDGLIRANGTANLFLINPNGILFGANARLELGGSFLASTAEGLKFANGFEFSATSPQPPPLLTISAPIGLQYGSNPGEVRSQGANLQVLNGQTLSLMGGTININGGQLLAPGGRAELASVANSGEVELTQQGQEFQLSLPESLARANVFITNAAKVDVSADGGGSITVNAGNLELREGSQLLAGIREGLGKREAQAENITINATNSVKLDGEDKEGKDSGAFNLVNSRATGNAGDVLINTGSLEVTSGAQLDASTFGIGNAGKVEVKAPDLVKFEGEGQDGFESGARSEVVFDEMGTVAVGTAGGIFITTHSLEVMNGAQLSASTNGVGNAGSVTINATNSVKFAGQGKNGQISGAFSNVNRGAVGNAGGVLITTGSLEVLNDAEISASTFAKGNAGSVTIIATDRVKFAEEINGDSGGAFSQVNSLGVGNAGGISITTGSLEVLNGTNLAASTFGIGNAGSVTIIATGLVKFDGENQDGFESGAYSGVRFSNIRNAPAEGNAGGVSITAGSLEVLNGGLLDVSTDGVGDAGRITVKVTDFVRFDGIGQDGLPGGAFSAVESRSQGNSGGVSIAAGSLEVSNGAQISASTVGKGNAGNIEIIANTFEAKKGGQVVSRTSGQFSAGSILLKVKDNITLSGSDAGIFANTTEGSVGKGGSIFIDPRIFIIRDGATVSANSQGAGIGGDIQLAASSLTLDRGTISAETRSNTGGNITLNLQDLLLLRKGSQISTTAGKQEFGGNGGNISLDSNFIVAVPQENSTISANAFSGRGGNIRITTQGLFGIAPRASATTGLSSITASSQFGISGTIVLNTPDVDPSRGTATLPSGVIDINALIASSCVARRSRQGRFVITGTGGLAPQPDNLANTAFSTYELIPEPSKTERSQSSVTEADRIYRLNTGEIVLGRSCQ